MSPALLQVDYEPDENPRQELNVLLIADRAGEMHLSTEAPGLRERLVARVAVSLPSSTDTPQEEVWGSITESAILEAIRLGL